MLDTVWPCTDVLNTKLGCLICYTIKLAGWMQDYSDKCVRDAGHAEEVGVDCVRQ